MIITANVDGRLMDAREAALSPLDRSFLYGDSVYEVWRTYLGVLFAWDEHWQRLNRSAASLSISLELSADAILSAIEETVQFHLEREPSTREVYIRLQVSRGAGPVGLDPGLAEGQSWTILVRSLPEWGVESYHPRICVARNIRRNPDTALNPAWKTGNYLNNILGLQEARHRGFDDVLFLNQAGNITEASTSNVFFLHDGFWKTPPLGDGILAGVTRQLCLDHFQSRGEMGWREESIPDEEVANCEACFLTSTTRDITWVTCLENRNFSPSIRDRVMLLKRQFHQGVILPYIALHPEFRVLHGRRFKFRTGI